MNFLKNHPFAVEAFFESSKVLTFAVPKKELEGLIPECLTLDTYEDTWAFIAIAMVQTKGLRPKGFPAFMGNDFFLIGYRIFVRFRNRAGKNLRGLYILKSETDKKKMEVLGSIFTRYSYTKIDIDQQVEDNVETIRSEKSKFNVVIENTPDEVDLPLNSPFPNWKEARKFAGPLPHTFTYTAEEGSVLIVQGLRQNWKPKPIKINSHDFKFLNDFNFKRIVLANAFEITNVPYSWKKGKLEKWG